MVSVCHRSRCVMAHSSPRGHPPPQWPARVAHDHPLGPRGAPSPPDCRGEGRLLDGLRSGARPTVVVADVPPSDSQALRKQWCATCTRVKRAAGYISSVHQHGRSVASAVPQPTVLASWGWHSTGKTGPLTAALRTRDEPPSRSGPHGRLWCGREARSKPPILFCAVHRPGARTLSWCLSTGEVHVTEALRVAGATEALVHALRAEARTLRTCLLAYLLACVLACLRTCLLAYVLAHRVRGPGRGDPHGLARLRGVELG